MIQAFKKDACFVVDYSRKEIGVKQLGAHGDALGGVVASYVARAKGLDFLCVDRNFFSFTKQYRKLLDRRHGNISPIVSRQKGLSTNHQPRSSMRDTHKLTFPFRSRKKTADAMIVRAGDICKTCEDRKALSVHRVQPGVESGIV